MTRAQFEKAGVVATLVFMLVTWLIGGAAHMVLTSLLASHRSPPAPSTSSMVLPLF